MHTQQVSQSILDSITFVKYAHIDLPNTPDDAVRFHDRTTPYIVHPIWCAMTILTETTLSEELRLKGYQVLMWHDVLEDTSAELPDDSSDEVRQLIEAMSFASFAEEKNLIWERSNIIRLFKLYDKTSNLLDGAHMSNVKWNAYAEFTQRLISDVEANFGDLNIVKIAKAIAKNK